MIEYLIDSYQEFLMRMYLKILQIFNKQLHFKLLVMV